MESFCFGLTCTAGTVWVSWRMSQLKMLPNGWRAARWHCFRSFKWAVIKGPWVMAVYRESYRFRNNQTVFHKMLAKGFERCSDCFWLFTHICFELLVFFEMMKFTWNSSSDKVSQDPKFAGFIPPGWWYYGDISDISKILWWYYGDIMVILYILWWYYGVLYLPNGDIISFFLAPV